MVIILVERNEAQAKRKKKLQPRSRRRSNSLYKNRSTVWGHCFPQRSAGQDTKPLVVKREETFSPDPLKPLIEPFIIEEIADQEQPLNHLASEKLSEDIPELFEIENDDEQNETEIYIPDIPNRFGFGF